MGTTPAAEVDITIALVRRLLEEQHPDLAKEGILPFASGWDNAIFQLGDDLLVRLPRRTLSSELVGKEQRWLGAIADRVDVAVPVPVRIGVPSHVFPWPWSVTAKLPGELVADLPRSQRSSLAEPLAAFVAGMAENAPADAPRNPWRGVPLVERDESMQERLQSGALPRSGDAARLWGRAIDQPEWGRPTVWVHGDLHPANLLAQDGLLSAVLDFGDLCAGDPATDLAAAWLVFDAVGRERFRAAVNQRLDCDDATWRRAEGWALVMASAVLLSSDDSALHRELGEETLTELLG